MRCGACLTVFVGIDHLQSNLEQAVALANPKQSIDQLLGEIDEFELGEISVPAVTVPAFTESVSIESVSIESAGPVVEIENSTAPSDLLDEFSPDIEVPRPVEVVGQVIDVDEELVEPEPVISESLAKERDLPTNPARAEPERI